MSNALKKQKFIIELIDQAGTLSHRIDQALSRNDANIYSDVFKQYSLWKLKCRPVFYESNKLIHPEYYAVFSHSDGVTDLADMAFNDGALYVKGLQNTYKNEDGEILVDDESIRQMKAAGIGLEKRKNALITLLQKIKEGSESSKVIDLMVSYVQKTVSREFRKKVLDSNFKKSIKRFNMIELIIRSGDLGVIGEKLKSTKFGRQDARNEIIEINKKLLNDLSLSKKPIMQGLKNTGQGYKIDKKYYRIIDK